MKRERDRYFRYRPFKQIKINDVSKGKALLKKYLTSEATSDS